MELFCEDYEEPGGELTWIRRDDFILTDFIIHNYLDRINTRENHL